MAFSYTAVDNCKRATRQHSLKSPSQVKIPANKREPTQPQPQGPHPPHRVSPHCRHRLDTVLVALWGHRHLPRMRTWPSSSGDPGSPDNWTPNPVLTKGAQNNPNTPVSLELFSIAAGREHGPHARPRAKSSFEAGPGSRGFCRGRRKATVTSAPTSAAGAAAGGAVGAGGCGVASPAASRTGVRASPSGCSQWHTSQFCHGAEGPCYQF